MRAQALFCKRVLAGYNGIFSYMNSLSCKVQVRFKKVQPPDQVRIDDGSQAKSFVFHNCCVSLESIRHGGPVASTKVNALCSTLVLPVIGETG